MRPQRVIQGAVSGARSEGGFTIIVALGVLMVTALLVAAVFAATQGDVALTRADLDGKRAYAAAQSAVQTYLYQLNDNASTSQWWETCANDMSGGTGQREPVPGTTTGAEYSYAPVGTCVASNPVGSLIDPTTGSLRIKFTGYAGSAQRSLVASFKTLSPLSFLWYTVYETEDNSLPGANGCDKFYYDDPSLSNSPCAIVWVTGDQMNGPMYTQDQFLVGNNQAPVFGEPGSHDVVASQVPSTANTNEICANDNCYGAQVSNPQPDITPQVPLPSDNASLLSDAIKHGVVYSGTTTLKLSIDATGNTVANGWTCTSATSCTAITNLNIDKVPIMYAQDASGGCTSSYTPATIKYSTNSYGAYSGTCGDIYVSGVYNTPLTVAASDDIVVTGNLTNAADANPTGSGQVLSGSATLGLVANSYVRVMHPCTPGYGNPNVTIDGAILTLQHSFFVDNYACGGKPHGTLTVHGAIAQYFRGIVGEVDSNGYLKNYNYDDRLALILPPYLFDLQSTAWQAFRETLCNQSSSSASYCGAT